jgi:hypothetical protein
MGNDTVKREMGTTVDTDIKINHERFRLFRYHEVEDLLEINMEIESER